MEENLTGRVPGEVVEVYRPPEYREIVETYTRSLPDYMDPVLRDFFERLDAQEEQKRKKRRRRGLLIFLVLLVAAAGLALGARFWPRQPERGYYEGDWHGALEETEDEEITIPAYPTGQGVTFTLQRDKGETITAQEVYKKVNPSVVTVMARLDEGKDYSRTAVGTGVIFTSDGYIITNHHVVEGGKECAVTLDTGYTYEARFVASDAENDLAVLKVEAQDLPAASFADSDSLTVGDKVYAIGNPLGVELRGTLTDGIVSAINRDVQVDDRTMTLIQTNAALNSGNSGGPLINECGQVVGINVVKMMSDYENVEGLGFAIPTASMERIVNDLLEYGSVQPEPSLGLMVSLVGEELSPGVWGIRVEEVTEGSAAEKAGVQVGDYVVEADGEFIYSSQKLLRVRSRFHLGDEMNITVWRDGQLMELTLDLQQAATK